MIKRIAILGGGPSGLFMYKRLVETGRNNFTVDIFEAKEQLGNGMPYSYEGANKEHITNVSGNEIPALVTTVMEWMASVPDDTLEKYKLGRDWFNDFMVLPRLLFGEYLSAQFDLLEAKARKAGLITQLHLNSRVTDIMDVAGKNTVMIEIGGKDTLEFDLVIVCTGHNWPVTQEGKVPGYYDSPYPPSKLKLLLNHAIAIKGSSLTAIDAIRTLARNNGTFIKEGAHRLSFQLHEDAKNFKIVMHSRQGLLPAIRFHLEDSHLSKEKLLTKDDIVAHMKGNNGFLSLDFIFEKDFKDLFRDKDPSFYDRIKDMNIEAFVESMMNLRERIDPFVLFKKEYDEADKSIRRKQSVYWKEMLAVLSFAMNYPAKYLSAEDMQRLQQVLMPLISIVIAFVPQSSCEELIALQEAGVLELISVGDDSQIEVHPEGGIMYHYTDDAGEKQQTSYRTFIDCVGQRHLMLEAFPFKSLVNNGVLSAARLKFRSAERGKEMYSRGDKEVERSEQNDFYLKVPGIAITDSFRVVEKSGEQNPRIYMMAVPYMGGYNPDYSGLDFCEEASRIIVADIVQQMDKSDITR